MSVALLEARLAEVRRTHLAPPPRLSVSDWSDAERIVPSYSAEPGPWRTSRTPYLREIMDCFSDPTVNEVVFMKCARIGGTEAGINVMAYFMAQDPSPILVVQPRVEDAKDFSKEQLAPTIADTPALRGRVKDPRSRDSGNTVQAKLFPGGALWLVGANSPAGFRRRTVRVVILEEVDGYDAQTQTEGDVVKLAGKRTATFAHRRKIYMNSTPTLKGLSKIEKAFLNSDQRRYHVPCPDCGHLQPLVWGNLKYEGLQEPAYACAECGGLIPESQKLRMLAAGQWVPHNPGHPVRGYHINALYSPWVEWRQLVTEWVEAQSDLAKLQAFVNTALGETWEDRTGALDPSALEQRRESYGPDVDIPNGVGVLTAGVDVQHDRIEAVVRGWGAGEESWRVGYWRFYGNTADLTSKVWKDLDDLLGRMFRHESGADVRIAASAVDSGDQQETVLGFTKPRIGRRIFAVKGSSSTLAPLLPSKVSRNNKTRTPQWIVGVHTAKDIIYGRLKLRMPGPGYLHFDMDADAEYFRGLTAERPVRKQIGEGRWVKRYELPRGERNEPLDCEVYALVALYLAPVPRSKLAQAAAKLAAWVKPAEPEPPADDDQPPQDDAAEIPPPAPPRPSPRRGGNWVTGGGQWGRR